MQRVELLGSPAGSLAYRLWLDLDWDILERSDHIVGMRNMVCGYKRFVVQRAFLVAVRLAMVVDSVELV